MKQSHGICAALLLLLLGQSADAVPVRFEFSGSLDNDGWIDLELQALGLVEGTLFTGVFAYDTDTLPFHVDDRFGVTRYRGGTLEMIVGDYHFSYAVPEFTVFNDGLPEEPSDDFIAGGPSMGPNDVSDIPGITGLSISFGLADPSASAFDDRGLPADLDLADFARAEISFIGRSLATTELVGFIGMVHDLRRVDATVAEPGSAALLLGGLVGLIGIRRRVAST